MSIESTRDEKLPCRPEDHRLLWHFTSVEALPKILLGNDGILAGHASFMDDPLDCSLSYRLLASIATIVATQHKGDDDYLEKLRTVYTPAIKRVQEGASFPIFIACFSTKATDPKMWKVRTGKMGGFAIGFRRDALMEDISSSADNTSFETCSYTTFEEHNQLVSSSEQLAVSTNELLNAGGNVHQKVINAINERLKMAKMVVSTKRTEFAFENEIRLVSMFLNPVPSPRLRYINGKPYVTIPSKTHIRNYVEKILVSPYRCVEQSMVVASLVANEIGLSQNAVEEVSELTVPNTAIGVCEELVERELEKPRDRLSDHRS